jgi:transposase
MSQISRARSKQPTLPSGEYGRRSGAGRARRAALVLRHMEGLSYAEIAEVLEVPDGTAKGWVSRGRAATLIALAEERTLSRMVQKDAS